MQKSIEAKITKALGAITDPVVNKPITKTGMLSSVQVSDAGVVVVILQVKPEQGAQLEALRQEVERIAATVKGVSKATAILTAERKSDEQPKKRPPAAAADPHGMAKNPPVDVPAKHVIVVASGKGGVGKSTVSANLAAYLANCIPDKPLKVGLLDADIYGPSQPLMMGDEVYKPELNEKKQLIPLVRHNMKIMSIGFMTDKDKALVWRGPMVQTAFYQMLRDVDWGTKDDPLDYLIIDLPPGTGDVQLTLAQKLIVDGAVIVSTPQDIALIDARKAVAMFGKTGVPVLGLVENMSSYVCSNCGHEDHIFGHGGAEGEAKDLGIPFLGAVPLSKDVRILSDAGTPIVLKEPESPSAKAFAAIAQKLL